MFNNNAYYEDPFANELIKKIKGIPYFVASFLRRSALFLMSLRIFTASASGSSDGTYYYIRSRVVEISLSQEIDSLILLSPVELLYPF